MQNYGRNYVRNSGQNYGRNSVRNSVRHVTIFAVEDYGPRGDRMSTRGWCIRMRSSMSGMEILEARFGTSQPNVKVPGAASYAFAVINQSLSLEQRPFA